MSDTLDLIRQILAKAESTPYPEEAEMLSARAEKLMIRHGIEQAMLHKEAPGKVTREYRWYDDRYSDAWATMWDAVSRGLGTCAIARIKQGGRLGVIIFGTAEDIAFADQLVTSLILQAQNGMKVWWKPFVNAGYPRSQVFREKRSYLIGFAVGVEDRMTLERQVAEGESTGSALVLADRRTAAQNTMQNELNLVKLKDRKHHTNGMNVGRADGQRANVGMTQVGGARRQINR